ncbi:flavin-containing monooxygenase [Arthrobacter nitrophenolicus]|uniref:Cation diffusion facilitator CzcD-associated flavoprotein CzcO n=2 Tax=Arthrobacter nitrophenolicus TaxID=683150 RepID=A0ACC6TKZ7_9MICC|nr:NAD(P)/FAD-dependent oxidoreductase [Arthrobacter nitrophenolicus]ELT42777.1 flavin-containing monooxygenase FMO [Arthrobacter nitrophenolicus]
MMNSQNVLADNEQLQKEAERVNVAIIGSGFSGTGLAIQLKRSGEESFVVLEREHSLGGTWRDNHYPGAACDVQSHLYSYSFKPKPEWSRVYARQPEILEYLRDCATSEGVDRHMRFDSEVLGAAWIEESNEWLISTANGSYLARVLVTASGHLSDPKYPNIPGIDDFKGAKFHSARWDHDTSLEGKRVGVIGTGASAIQIIPEVAKVAGKLTVFQRSAPYVVPRMDREYSTAEKNMFARLPHTAEKLRRDLFWAGEARFPQRRGIESFISRVEGLALDHLADQIKDPDLRAKLTPDYAIGCKRVLISNEYYPTYLRENVELETQGIERITENAVVMKDGSKHDLDALIVSTGFETSDLPISHRIHGTDGLLLADHWARGEQAYACSTVNGFPNLFIMNGPNSGLGAGSIIFVIESQIDYILGALDYLHQNGYTRMEVTQDAEMDFAAMIDRNAQGTVWLEGGCKSWYVDERNGRLSTIWPDFMSRFRDSNGVFRPEAYEVRSLAEQKV